MITIGDVYRARELLREQAGAVYDIAFLFGQRGPVVRGSLALVDRTWTRRPRSKRGRIRKKWRKDPRNWTTTPKPDVFYIRGDAYRPDTIVGHPATLHRLEAAMLAARYGADR